MNKKATQQQLEKQSISLAKWVRKHNLDYQVARNFIYSSQKPMFTLKQMAVLDALRTDGLLVEDENKEAA